MPGIPKALAVTLAAVFLAPSVLSAAGGAHSGPPEDKATVRERVLKIPAGAIVVVRLHDKEKVKGRLGEVTDEAFTVQTATGSETEKRSVSFADVKSIKTAPTTGHKVGRGLIIAGVAIGATILVVVIVLLSAEGG